MIAIAQELTPGTLAALAGFMGGIVLGVAARWGHFCSLGAIEDTVLGGNTTRLKSWGIAVAIAIAGTYALDQTSLIEITNSIYLSSPTTLLATLVGALIFGFGMALTGTCGYGTLARIGGGDLKSLVTFLVMGIAAYATMRGATSYLRLAIFPGPANSQVSSDTTATLAALGAQMTGHYYLSAYALALIILSASLFRNRKVLPAKPVISGVMVGVCIVWGWYATGRLATDSFNPYPLESYTFSAPLGETLIYLMTMTGASLKFGIGSTLGVIIGALITALLQDNFRWEACDDARELKRQIFGGLLMGFGGVTAVGCTVGQGLSAASTLALSAPVAIAGFFGGAWIGLLFLVDGHFFRRLQQ